ncbi:MAG: carboxymethylenebutenolidase [Rhodocyclales bacterium]|nr:carboxymethylenebutenolidase [Rhodocyclales bacterium]
MFRSARRRLFLSALSLCILACASARADEDGPPQIVFNPSKPKGPIVVVISGQTGPPNYEFYAKKVAELGYYTVLIDGKDILTRQQDGAQNLRKVIAKAQTATQAIPGKVAVVSFSQGGGGSLAHAITMPDQVSMIAAHYPATSWSRDVRTIGSRLRVPMLVLSGEMDHYNNNCCSVESMRELEAGAKSASAPMELVIYPQADHGFNLMGKQFRSDDAADAWKRVVAMLGKYQPLP